MTWDRAGGESLDGRVASLRTTSLVAFNRTNCRIDRSLQKFQPVADNHFSVAITLPFVIEFLSYIGVGVGSLATWFRLRTEQWSCWQRNWHPFGGANCLIDRALQKLKPADSEVSDIDRLQRRLLHTPQQQG
jgi:hypothetical protein